MHGQDGVRLCQECEDDVVKIYAQYYEVVSRESTPKKGSDEKAFVKIYINQKAMSQCIAESSRTPPAHFPI